ncbi:MAG: glycosyltransferase [Oligoflexales bacterium]|nr:glycosyltransferase [Oligoflexales bacterium]
MSLVKSGIPQVAFVYGTLPCAEEIDQLQLLQKDFEISVISSESIIGFLLQNSFSRNLNCIPLPDHDEDTTFLPGLEKVLEKFDIVVIKERLGIYAFQAVKAKLRFKFRLLVLIDNLTVLPADDVQRIRSIRKEVSESADGFIVQSKAAKNTLITEGISAEKISLWPCWVKQRENRDKEHKRQALGALSIGERDILIVFNGQVEWEEGLLDLLHAIKLIKDKDSSLKHRLKLAICGIGSFANEIKQRSLQLGIDADIIYLAPNRDCYLTLLQAADAIYVGGFPARDRVDGDPFRIISAMIHGIPVLAPRTPISEEFLGKHRLDYCNGSPVSIAATLEKLVYSKKIVHNVIHKNLSKADASHNEELARKSILESFNSLLSAPVQIRQNAIDEQIELVESKISSKQYLAGISLIEKIFEHYRSISYHHQATLHRLIGDCFTKLGDRESGKNAYVKAIELDEYSPKAHIGLGTISLTKANYDIGIIHFQRAVSLAPNDEMANLGLGLSFHGLDELREAQKWVCKALEINPENTAAIYTLVKIAGEREVYDDLEHVLNTYLKLHPHDQDMVYTLAGILYKMNKFDEVVESLKTITCTNPMDARAQSLIKQAKRAIEKKSVEPSVG